MKFSLDKSKSIARLKAALREGQSIVAESLWDVPKALLAVLAVEATGRSVLLLTGGAREDRLFDNLDTLAPGLALEFPAWETLPGEEIAPSRDLLGKRFQTLAALQERKGPSILLCPLPSLLQKVLPRDTLVVRTWRRGQKLPFSQLPEQLTELGYKRVPVVGDKGEFAVRGGILDLFPLSSPDPYRVEFDGDTIDEIRSFDPIGQKSVGKVESFLLPPADELRLLQQAKRLVPVTDYLGESPLLLWDNVEALEEAYVSLQGMPGARTPFLFQLDDLLKRAELGAHLFCPEHPLEEISPVTTVGHEVQFESLGRTFQALRWVHPFLPAEGEELYEQLRDFKEILFLNANESEEQEVRRQLAFRNLSLDHARYETGYLTSGLFIRDIPFALIPHTAFTQRLRVRRQKQRSAHHTTASEFHELTPGDHIVHFHSGVGKYLGIEKHQDNEYLALEYAEGSKLFVPFSQAHLVSRYIGAHEAAPPLSQLGGKRWQVQKQAALNQIVGYAHELLELYAERAAFGGFRYPPDGELMQRFERDFPYEETDDQLRAIEDCKRDMCSEKAMDRLICGDVGYGKTEVAMRAAFKAVVDGGKQVAVLVPTTVLALQHYDNFKARMEGFPVRVEALSRFQTPKEIKRILARLATGDVDILIGTHRLLSPDVPFKDLGLLIIDEEQRFGVRAKEKLKKLKKGLDTLILSATPIPRTLYFSLVSARDMSVIHTPPHDRLPIKTIIAESDPTLIQNALMRELARGGQAFYIHNRVESIHSRATEIQKLIPQARVGVAHGQMDPEDLDLAFHRFKQGELDLLFATTIVENGIDIPNANTILIERSDTYGLADLYQLRGRVGRWNRAAFAYFLTPRNTVLPEIAQKRLRALAEASGHGGGMKVALRDLEIRGAGDLLGVQQSGQVSTIGFHLYCKLLRRAIDAFKKQAPLTFLDCKVEAPFDARLPESYVPEVSLRMELYYRFGEALYHDLPSLLAELRDRFGEPPLPTLYLYHLSRLRAFASANAFTLLKFQNLTLLAEQQQGKQIEKRTLIIKKINQPSDLETAVIPLLQKNFPTATL